MSEKNEAGSIAATAWTMALHLKSNLPEGKGDERITAWLDLVGDCQAALSGKRQQTDR